MNKQSSSSNKHFIIILVLLLLAFILRLQQAGGVSSLEPEPDFELEKIASFFEPARDWLASRVEELLPQPQSGLLTGIVLGVKSSLPAEFKKALRNTSTIHIVVVSGQNLTLLAGLIMNLSILLGRRKTVCLSLLVILFYAALTGLQIPVLRAALMVLFASAALLFGRESQGWWILILTGFVMLIYNPNWLVSVSFQLSFLATLAVVAIAPELIKRLNFLPDLVKQDLAVTLAAQALTWPVIAANFHQASLIGILVNSLILWTVPFIMVSGLFAIFGALAHQFLGEILILVPGVLLTYFTNIILFFNQSWSSIYIGKVHWLVWAGYYLLVLGVFLFLKKANRSSPL